MPPIRNIILSPQSAEEALKIVREIYLNHYSSENFAFVEKYFYDFKALYEGKYPGYKKCASPYHNIFHTCDVFAALARLIDGYNIKEKKLPVKKVNTALAAALFHDSGFIEKKGKPITDTVILNHEERSVLFFYGYSLKNKISKEDFKFVSRLIECTDLGIDIRTLKYKNDTEKLLGSMLAAADIMGQMGARTYLEQLKSLYEEFKPVNIYDSEMSLVQKTIDFYKVILKKLKLEYGGVDKYYVYHFKRKHNIKKNVYREAVKNQMDYLNEILNKDPENYRKYLKRSLPES